MRKKSGNQTLTLALSGMMAALVFVATYFFKLPVSITQGYIHLGDGFILLGASLLGWASVPAAAIGSALADLLGGYTLYILPTFVIKGLVAAVIQQYGTREVLMVGYMNDEALRRTLTTGRVTFWSRSRQEYWRKGDTSGHVQYVKGVSLDCDGDALLVEVDQVGAACHTGKRSCFLEGGPLPVVEGHRPAEQ